MAFRKIETRMNDPKLLLFCTNEISPKTKTRGCFPDIQMMLADDCLIIFNRMKYDTIPYEFDMN